MRRTEERQEVPSRRIDGSEDLRRALSEVGLRDYRLFMGMSSILRARQAVSSRLSRVLEPLDLSVSQFLVLLTLAMRRKTGVKLGRLARAMLVHPATVTQMVDGLEARGSVERRPHPGDRRAILAVLTDSGFALVEEAIAATAKAEFGLAGISPEGADLLFRTLQPLGGGLWSRDPRD